MVMMVLVIGTILPSLKGRVQESKSRKKKRKLVGKECHRWPLNHITLHSYTTTTIATETTSHPQKMTMSNCVTSKPVLLTGLLAFTKHTPLISTNHTQPYTSLWVAIIFFTLNKRSPCCPNKLIHFLHPY